LRRFGPDVKERRYGKGGAVRKNFESGTSYYPSWDRTKQCVGASLPTDIDARDVVSRKRGPEWGKGKGLSCPGSRTELEETRKRMQKTTEKSNVRYPAMYQERTKKKLRGVKLEINTEVFRFVSPNQLGTGKSGPLNACRVRGNEKKKGTLVNEAGQQHLADWGEGGGSYLHELKY